MTSLKRCKVCNGLLSKRQIKFCSPECRNLHQKNKPCLSKVGDYRKSNGYILTFQPDYPGHNASGWIAEHIYIMSQHLGRPLKEKENVHHKNSIKTDNRIENLELWTHAHPTGQRVIDMITFCRWYLSMYSYEADNLL